jgi:hypothetical protein
MKNLRLIIAMLLFLPLFSCSAQTTNKDVVATSSNSDKIEAYYFHFTARCITCNTIEAKAKENLESLYPQHVKGGLITFQSVNLDDAGNKPLAKKLGIAGQTLILVKGDEKINITNEGFMYAMVKPEKFKEVINEKVDLLLAKK